MARLLLLALGLLCPSAANEAKEEAPPRPPSLLLRGAAQSAGALDEGNATSPALGRAKEDFVRKCTVALSVRSAGALPLGALEEFCRSTDAVVECKMQLVTKLKAVHEQGGSVSGFCGDAYVWFQKKYGMLCPMQCEKLQCRSTCEWLKELKQIREERKQLDIDGLKEQDETSAEKALRKELQNASTALLNAKDQAKAASRSVRNLTALVARLEEQLKEREAEAQEASGEASKLDEKIKSLQDARSTASKKLEEQRQKLRKLQFKVDKAALDNNILTKKAKRLGKKIKSQVDALRELPQKIAQSKSNMEERLRAQEGMAQTDARVREIIEEQAAVVANRSAKMEKARGVVSDAEALEDGLLPLDVIEAHRDLFRQQKARYLEEKILLDKAKHYRKMFLAERNRSVEELSVEEKELKGLEGSVGSRKAAISDIAEQIGEVELAAKDLRKKTLLKLAKRIAAVRGSMGDLTEEYVKINKTLALTKNDPSQDTPKKRRALEQQTRSALERAQAQRKRAGEEDQRAQEVLGNATAREAALRTKLSEMAATVDKQLQASKRAERRLRRRAPEIVRQHGLGAPGASAAS